VDVQSRTVLHPSQNNATAVPTESQRRTAVPLPQRGDHKSSCPAFTHPAPDTLVSAIPVPTTPISHISSPCHTPTSASPHATQNEGGSKTLTEAFQEISRSISKKLAQPKEQWRIHPSQQLTCCSHSLSTRSLTNFLDALHQKWD